MWGIISHACVEGVSTYEMEYVDIWEAMKSGEGGAYDGEMDVWSVAED